jgi:hypothetical protein
MSGVTEQERLTVLGTKPFSASASVYYVRLLMLIVIFVFSFSVFSETPALMTSVVQVALAVPALL